MKSRVIDLLAQRGVSLPDIGELVYLLQNKYNNGLLLEECTRCVNEVLEKREVQFAILTGIALDMLAEQKVLPEPLQTIVETDEPLYGVDEIMALGITNIYGSIGLTNFGFLDRQKIGVLSRLDHDEKHNGQVHTFLDDLLAGVAAAAAAKLAHSRARRKPWQSEEEAPPAAAAPSGGEVHPAGGDVQPGDDLPGGGGDMPLRRTGAGAGGTSAGPIGAADEEIA